MSQWNIRREMWDCFIYTGLFYSHIPVLNWGVTTLGFHTGIRHLWSPGCTKWIAKVTRVPYLSATPLVSTTALATTTIISAASTTPSLSSATPRSWVSVFPSTHTKLLLSLFSDRSHKHKPTCTYVDVCSTCSQLSLAVSVCICACLCQSAYTCMRVVPASSKWTWSENRRECLT